MPTAWLAIRDAVHYRRDAFVSGLQRCGFRVQKGAPNGGGNKGDILVIWNRYGQNHRVATLFEQRGLAVLVAENGYLGDILGKTMLAMSRSHHNGAGVWPEGGPERWDALGVDLMPWRPIGGETVILPQRGIGPPGVAMPARWPKEVEKLGRVRRHPGTNKTGVSLRQDLSNASAVVTWGSGAAIKALVWGIPAFHAFPQWIGAPAARPLKHMGMGPRCDDAARLAMFRRLAWAQWTLDEITSGEAIKRLLEIKC